jgi:PmbA protein
VAVFPIDEILKKGSQTADEVEVYITDGLSVSGDLKRTKVSRAVESRYFGLSVRTIKNGRIGNSSSSNPGDWEKCLDASIASGKLATPQPWKGLPGPASLDDRPIAYDPSLTPNKNILVDLLKGMIDGASSHPVEVMSGGAAISVQTLTIANSNGLYYTRHHSHASASIETIRGNSTGYEFGNSYTLDLDPVSIGDRAGFLAAASYGGVDISSGSYDVVLSPVAFAQLLGAVLIPSLSGRNVHAGRSKLANSIGMNVIDRKLSLLDDPFLEKGLSSTRWRCPDTTDFIHQRRNPRELFIRPEDGIPVWTGDHRECRPYRPRGCTCHRKP